MKIKSVEVRKNFKAGDKVYACAYKYTKSKEYKAYHQEPVLGMLTAGNTEDDNEYRIKIGSDRIEYFVPFKKNGTDLAWSKAVSLYARCYASTYEECVELYNELIEEAITWHTNEIEKLRCDLL